MTCAILQHFTYQNKKNNTTQWHKSSQWSCGQQRISELKSSSDVLHNLLTRPETGSCFISLIFFVVVSQKFCQLDTPALTAADFQRDSSQVSILCSYTQQLEDSASKGGKVNKPVNGSTLFYKTFMKFVLCISTDLYRNPRGRVVLTSY